MRSISSITLYPAFPCHQLSASMESGDWGVEFGKFTKTALLEKEKENDVENDCECLNSPPGIWKIS
jgi:hypothetical protein